MLNTLFVVLTYLQANTKPNGGVYYIEAHLMGKLASMLNFMDYLYDVPYPMRSPDSMSNERLIAGGLKVGRNLKGYYIKNYSDSDIQYLIDTLWPKGEP